MKARIYITPKLGVLDPQGKAIEQALLNLGFLDINSVRQGKYFEVDLKKDNLDKAKKDVESMCKKLLANTVIEDYKIELF